MFEEAKYQLLAEAPAFIGAGYLLPISVRLCRPYVPGWQGLDHEHMGQADIWQKTTPAQNNSALGFEAELFKAADKLRGNMEPSDYKHVALGLIFLKYISDAFEVKRQALLAEDAQAVEDKDEYLAAGADAHYSWRGLDHGV